MFEFFNIQEPDLFKTALLCAGLVVGAMFIEVCWKTASDQKIATDEWIKSKLSLISDQQIRAKVREMMLIHTGEKGRVLDREDFEIILSSAKMTITAGRQNSAIERLD